MKKAKEEAIIPQGIDSAWSAVPPLPFQGGGSGGRVWNVEAEQYNLFLGVLRCGLNGG